MVRHLCDENWIKLAHLEEVKVVTRFVINSINVILLPFLIYKLNFKLKMSGSFAEALAAAFSKINEVPRATCKINKYWD